MKVLNVHVVKVRMWSIKTSEKAMIFAALDIGRGLYLTIGYVANVELCFRKFASAGRV